MTYTTILSETFDLSDLDEERRAYLDRALAAFREGMAFNDFANSVVNTSANPALRASNGWVTRAAWEDPFFKAIRDLGDRLGVQQGKLTAANAVGGDPVSEEWVPSVEAAKQKGVTLGALHLAIERGELLARPIKPGGSRLRVSARSLDRWTPNRTRQAAGRARATAAR